MANRLERRPARLVCVRGHEYLDEAAPQVGMKVAEQGETIWRIEEGTDLRCLICGEEIDYSRSEPL